jgi:hypothetical protein
MKWKNHIEIADAVVAILTYLGPQRGCARPIQPDREGDKVIICIKSSSSARARTIDHPSAIRRLLGRREARTLRAEMRTLCGAWGAPCIMCRMEVLPLDRLVGSTIGGRWR